MLILYFLAFVSQNLFPKLTVQEACSLSRDLGGS